VSGILGRPPSFQGQPCRPRTSTDRRLLGHRATPVFDLEGDLDDDLDDDEDEEEEDGQKDDEEDGEDEEDDEEDEDEPETWQVVPLTSLREPA
jgi:hypothetical protein